MIDIVQGVQGHWDTRFDKVAEALAEEHAQNYGHLIGEVLRRVTGATLKQFVRDEIAGPLGADFQIGALPEDTDRIADIIPSTDPLELPPFDQLPEPMIKT